MAYFPLFVEISKKKCLVVGGGQIAFDRIAALFDFGAQITVIAPKIIEDIKEISGVTCIERDFQESDVEGQFIVVAASDSKDENSKISEICKQVGIHVNVIDSIEESTFLFSEYIKQRDVVAAFTSSGKCPVIDKYMKLQNTKTFDSFLGEINDLFYSIKRHVDEGIQDPEKRILVYEDLLEASLILRKKPTMDQVGSVIEHVSEK
ncbi:precorrin-2 dehydrogenase/sirohydrochlorin ferrochelatase family protein [Lachnobacterium bovis]|jgi:uroporphyrin-III C-methyltransferase/precorrin-2 dehydrogenase/sirohydrochlorin ferrochelatase/precorrin-2 dehydrogenase/sirohydrochlorin ferrochelatase|uniref:precorrin-2 dehydrogenase n=1 Tax=Lachnobacterium bovis TaxID=140626 RepID=A0A1H9PDB2_9FIRM|nr:bifunctional precorrin-2 dehydrogenase/sirohydrochlorin ferrochelatase [Lachnobacterium bovis]SER46142.1 precorrin-2 dehydrogenase / sirohydrochlorin ferrochelatase [Lachnobacterium bovis]